MEILVTEFDPFGGDKINLAIKTVKRLPDEINGAEIIKLEIPTAFSKSAEVIKEAIEKENPDYVLDIGQIDGRFGLTSERVAININDDRTPDNESYQPLGKPIHEDGEIAYFIQLSIKAGAKATGGAGLSANISDTAGACVCNHIMYQVQYTRDEEFPNVKAGFIYIPFLPEQVVNRPNTLSMALDDIVKGLTAALGAIVERDGKDDIKAVEGANH